MTGPADASARGKSRWLHGPIPDVMLGCGLLYAFVALAFSFEGGALFYGMPPAVAPLLVAFVSAPHYGATLVRVYANAEDRRAYFLFSVVATGLLVALFGVALFDRFVGSVLTSVYLTWSGWHYTAQNYGIASLFLRRRDVDLTAFERRILYASFVLSYVIVFLVMHRAGQPTLDPTLKIEMISLGIPSVVNGIGLPLVGTLYLAATLAVGGILFRRAASVSDFVPTALVIGTQAIWLTIPFASQYFDWFEAIVPFSANARAGLFTWIAGAHAIQYLWITSFYARNEGAGGSRRWRGLPVYYLWILGAGAMVWIVPALFFAPRAGSFDWNFALLISAAVNLHHFVLDGVIWKLRHMKIARILIRDERVSAPERDAAVQAKGRVRWAVGLVAAAALSLELHSLVEQYFVFPRALERRDPIAARASLGRQDWLGRTNALKHLVVAREFDRMRLAEPAIEQYELSAAMEPHVATLRRLVLLYRETGDDRGFVRACDRFFDLDGIARPMPTPELSGAPATVSEDFAQRCVEMARTARLSKGAGASGPQSEPVDPRKLNSPNAYP